VFVAGAVLVTPRNLARGVDGSSPGLSTARGIERGVAFAVIEETVLVGGAVSVTPHDLARVVDGCGITKRTARGFERGRGVAHVDGIGTEGGAAANRGSIPRLGDLGCLPVAGG